MAIVLGISAYYHDSAAALCVDGKVAAAMQEERFSRIKNDPSVPMRAARACLDFAGVTPSDLDAVVFYENPFAKLERVLLNLMRFVPASIRQFPRAVASQLGSKIWILDQLSERLGVPRAKIEFVNHHQSHAASSFLLSPFDSAAVVVVDAVGQEACTSIWSGEKSTLRLRGEILYPASIGLFYAALTSYLGFQVNSGEYKVMGLAAYGAPRFREEFDQLITLHDDGSYELSLPHFRHHSDLERGFGPRLESLLGPQRQPGLRWNLDSPADQRFADIAATLQAVTEEALLGIARKARDITGEQHLCLAGGVALNAVANRRLLQEAGFQRVFVQPAAGDAGGALGAALLGSIERGDARPAPLASCALGLPVDRERAIAVCRELGLQATELGDEAAVAERIADRITDGKILALASGRFEWGPRALGQRSILASPHDREIREKLNRVVKGREVFRPFAPAVLHESCADYFEGPADDMTPFMTSVLPVREDKRSELAGITHTDGSARVQTVTEEGAATLHRTLRALVERGRAPIVLNTSLNGRDEPIVASAEDAIAFLLRHPIDALVVSDLLVERKR